MSDDTPDRLDDDFTSETLRDDTPADDTSGGPLSDRAGEGSGRDAEGAPDVNVDLDAPTDEGATEGAEGGDGLS